MLERLRAKQTPLAALERRYAALEEAVSAIGLTAAVVAVDPDAVVVKWNEGAERLYGWTAEEAIGANAIELLVPTSEREASDARFVRMRDGQTFESQITLRHKDSRLLSLWTQRSPVLHRGKVAGHLGITMALEDRDNLTKVLAESEGMKWSIMRAALDAIVVIDEHGKVLEFNPAAERNFGHAREQVLGKELAEILIPERFRGAHREGLARVLATGETHILDERIEAVALRADGSELPVELTVTRMHGEPPRFAGFVRDLSERIHAEKRIEELGGRDQLTGLPNLRSLRTELGEALSRADRDDRVVALLRVNLRRFSLVNDSLGRLRGDQLLREVGMRLSELEPAPEMVARDGGDEFWIVTTLPGTNIGAPSWRAEAVAAAAVRGAEVQAKLAEPFSAAGAELSLGASIGMTLYPLDALNPETMLDHAEVAKREAQRSAGRPAVMFSGQARDAGRELALTTRLSRALSAREFELHYQPVVDLKLVKERGPAAATLGVEALLRWRDPDQGLVAPDGFLPLLEETGLINAVGRWVVAELCRQLATWRASGHEISGAFNLSTREMWQPELVPHIAEQARLAGIDPHMLSVEITESAAMEDLGRAREVFDDLRAQGFRIAVDDFGMGHSSLGRLRELPVDILKIDRSFTSAVPGDQATEAIVAAILQAADGLGLQTFAEGIETEEQHEFMLGLGCEVGQGYLFGRPVPGAELKLS